MRPIGVFDSGVGGLTVVEALRRALPGESILYLGDTARLPYGTKSALTVTRYTQRNIAFLLERGVKAIVVACNTASALALGELESSVPTWGVIEPGAEAAAATSAGRVGIVATESTIESGAYAAALERHRADLTIVSEACPLFVPLVEEGWHEDPLARLVGERYLAPLIEAEIDTLILGCTHYPLLSAMISDLMGPEVQLVDSARAVAERVALELDTLGLAAVDESVEHHFCVTDSAARFRRLAERILGDDSVRSSSSSYNRAMPADSSPTRADGRLEDALRPVAIELDPLKFADGSALITSGDTRVLVAATIERRVPRFLMGSGSGWATAEYSMLPRATSVRTQREVKNGRPSGRTSEIQRLIGRSMRAALDLKAMPELTLTLDCDVLQADGGTRTASITGAWVAAVRALARHFYTGDLARWPVAQQIAAVSVGIVKGHPLLDLDAPEDQSADVDMNIVATVDESLIEVQGTAERATFTRTELDRLLDLANTGIADLCTQQTAVLADVLAEVKDLSSRKRRNAPPKDEASIWGAPE